MSRLGKRFEDMMSAASFAEAGEFDTARDLVKGDKKVLLVLTGMESEDKSFKYALNTAQRIGASLEVLTVMRSGRAEELLKHYTARAGDESVGLSSVKKTGCIKDAIVSHTRNRLDIQFVVVESTAMLETECPQETKTLRGALAKLHCPLVMVSELKST